MGSSDRKENLGNDKATNRLPNIVVNTYTMALNFKAFRWLWLYKSTKRGEMLSRFSLLFQASHNAVLLPHEQQYLCYNRSSKDVPIFILDSTPFQVFAYVQKVAKVTS